jgi:hypothetical protein
MKRTAATTVLVTACSLAASAVHASFAYAQPQDPRRFPAANQPFDLPAGYCAFPVHADPVGDREYLSQTSTPDGGTEYRVTGHLSVRFTNVDTGRSVVVNESGPGTIDVNPDGTVDAWVRGNSFGVASPAEQARAHVPGLFLLTGEASSHYDGSGLASVSTSGPVRDGCALLS